jgi:arylsulfatase A-like enzyme
MRLLLVDVDSLRPDHTGPYGYRRKITPNLDQLAAKAVVFGSCYCSDSPCLPSRAALSSGQFGICNGVVGHFGRAARFRLPAGHDHPADRPLLGGHLGNHGLYTASVSCFAERHLAYFFLGNFRESIRPSQSLGNDEDAQDVNRAAFRWLDQRGREDNWLLHVNYWEPHTDYVEPLEWMQKAGEAGPPPGWPDEKAIAAHQDIYGPRSATDLHAGYGRKSPRPATMPDAIRNRRDFVHLLDGYDGEVMYWDHRFGQLLDKLAELNILEETAIIVMADHGESLGENGSYGEHGLANEPTHHVPLIIRWPGLTTGLAAEQRRCAALLYSFDLGPTLCDLLGLPTPSGWHGQSFAPAVRGEPYAGREMLFLGQGAHTFQRAVRTRTHLYVRTLHTGCIRTEPEELFDMAADPFETASILDQRPDVAEKLRAAQSDWWHRYAGWPGAPRDPMQIALGEGPTLYTDPTRYLQFLEGRGRADLAAHLRRRLSSPPRP